MTSTAMSVLPAPADGAKVSLACVYMTSDNWKGFGCVIQGIRSLCAMELIYWNTKNDPSMKFAICLPSISSSNSTSKFDLFAYI